MLPQNRLLPLMFSSKGSRGSCHPRLRYPSRFPQKNQAWQSKPGSARRPSRSFSVPAEGRLRDGRRPDPHPAPSNWAQETLQTPEQLECQPSSSSADDVQVQVMKDFVRSEEARLRALSTAGSAEPTPSPLLQKDGARSLESGYRLSWEEMHEA